MSTIHVCREVDLDANACDELAVSLLDQLVGSFGGSYESQGKDYEYRHSGGVKALVTPRDGELEVNVKLGLMASAMAPKIEQEMNRALDSYLKTT